ncbi:MAG: DUF262 domain-containing protein [Bacteroidales bacterium]|jgi:uncharacterized protein with ParB-like and HNH nuclease domain|nr:DUF262 domain-containing protein [Bacteroidales bacterium]
MQFIEAKDKNLSDVLTNNRYKIDSFQREFRWQRKHIEALISDLCICFDKFYREGDTIENYEDYGGYYMGPIVLCDDKKSLSIVDGQQRLTSFSLLLIFLKHAQQKLNLPANQTKDLHQFLFVTKGGKTTFVLNVESRKNVMEHLYETPDIAFEMESDVKDGSIQSIIERFEDITKLFPAEFNTTEKLPIFIEWMLDKVIMVEVKAYSMDNAYTIFETMNDRGLSLNPTEILKGFLLSKIEDDTKSDEMNVFWKDRIAGIKTTTNIDGDLDFFRAWLRAKYAESIRPTKIGAENEDFEIIGTQFHSWVKNNSSKTFLKHSDDFYFFIRSDFDFFSNLYLKIYGLKNTFNQEFADIYCSNFYPIADSLSYPLLISPISKIDDTTTIEDKIKLSAKFLDIYTLTRVIIGKAITQSSIRYSMYEMVKSVRNLDTKTLKERLSSELVKLGGKPFSPLSILHRMDNWGFYHYLFARLLYKQNSENDFSSLLRSKKQNSLILYKFFDLEDKPTDIEDIIWQMNFNSVAGHCLVRRYDLENINSKKGIKLLNYLVKQNYMPEMIGYECESIIDFISERDHRLRELIDNILKF